MEKNQIIYIIIYLFIVIIIFYLIDKLYFNNQNINNNKNHKLCNYPHLILNKNQLSLTKELLIEFVKFATINNIPYFVTGGALIGTVRNGGLMPFDDDIDIGILENDEYIIKNYKNPIYYLKKTTHPWDYGYKFKKRNSKLFIDIMIFEEFNNNFYKIKNNLWPNETIRKDEIFPLIKKKYSNVTDVYVPYKYKQYLDRAFPKWDKQIRFNCGHHTNGNCFYKAFNISRIIDVNYDNSKFLCYSNL